MVTVIVNPVAGAQRGLKLVEPLAQFIAQHRVEAELVKTIAPGDGMHLASVALRKGHEHIVAVGGDGTVEEVLGGILGQRVTLGIVPIGLTNGIASGLGLPVDWKRALAVALSGAPKDIDVGLVGERGFLGVAGGGGEVRAHAHGAARSRFIRFAPTTSTRFRELLHFHCDIDGGLMLEAEAGAFAFSNVSTRSTTIPLSVPDPSDGMLELTLLGRDASERTQLRARRFTITAPRELALHLDGEILRQAAPLVVRVADDRQRILVDIATTNSTAREAPDAPAPSISTV